MEKRLDCIKPECNNTILQDTADRNDGLCMPCVHNEARDEESEYIRKNRRDLNEFDGISDRVEILKIINKPRGYDPLVNWIPYPIRTDQVYHELDSSDKERLADFCVSQIVSGHYEDVESIILGLSAFTDANLDECLRLMVSRNIFYPSLPFHSSPVDVRNELLSRVEKDSENQIHILCALAWIGDYEVIDRFDEWRNTPVSWMPPHFIAPHEYSNQAGWELTLGNERRGLFFPNCFKLINDPSDDTERFHAVWERWDKCPWCHSKLINLFTIDSDLLVVDWGGMISIPTCEKCTAFGVIYGEVNENGETEWSSKNTRPKYLPDDLGSWDSIPRDALQLGEASTPLSGADWRLPTTFSQLGGHPNWVQDAQYPKCPNCAETMMFLAQLDRSDIEELGEGIYYAFICLDCRTTATSYQQT